MSLNAAITLVLEEYLRESTQEFAGNALAELVRTAVPTAIQAVISDSARYDVKSSVGQGNWARVPWIAVFDSLVTDSAQTGYYVVFLFCEDCSGVHLSLNQGVTSVRLKYRSEAKQALKARANDFLSQLGSLGPDFLTGPIDLRVTSKSSLGADYEAGSICAKYYARETVPPDKALQEDLNQFLLLYRMLSDKELILPPNVSDDVDEHGLEVEDLISLREHKRIERNRRLANEAKRIHGATCQTCGFNFGRHYVEVGDGFIEAHHLRPLSQLKGQIVSMDPRNDFAVLCSNCHRMIHKTDLTHDIQAFRDKYLRSQQTRLQI